MKKNLLKTLCLLLVLLFAFAVVGCTKKVVIDGDFVVITADTKNVEENATLIDYMEYLQSEGMLTYEISDGMIISIDGKKGASNQYWMLYTSDAENSNQAWGTCEYQGETYDSASLGAQDLPIKDGCIYIWYLQTF